MDEEKRALLEKIHDQIRNCKSKLQEGTPIMNENKVYAKELPLL